FQRAVAKELFRRQRIDAYMFDVEVLAIASSLGYRIQQVPVRWRDDADSRLNLVAGNLRNMRDIFRSGLDHRFGGRRSKAGNPPRPKWPLPRRGSSCWPKPFGPRKPRTIH